MYLSKYDNVELSKLFYHAVDKVIDLIVENNKDHFKIHFKFEKQQIRH